MRTKLIIIAGLIFIALITFGITHKEKEFSLLKIKQKELVVEIARTDWSKVKGLSNRESLPQNQGLLMVHNQSQAGAIWMKEMNFPIDVIWLDSKMQIVDLESNLKPGSYPKKYSSCKPAQYILEVNQGFIKENQIKTGDQIIRMI